MGILKDQLTQSKLGLKGSTPSTREGALPTSKLHAQGSAMLPNHSVHDFDGLAPNTPGKVPYTANLPK
jgi:hypothetical protein